MTLHWSIKYESECRPCLIDCPNKIKYLHKYVFKLNYLLIFFYESLSKRNMHCDLSRKLGLPIWIPPSHCSLSRILLSTVTITAHYNDINYVELDNNPVKLLNIKISWRIGRKKYLLCRSVELIFSFDLYKVSRNSKPHFLSDDFSWDRSQIT